MLGTAVSLWELGRNGRFCFCLVAEEKDARSGVPVRRCAGRYMTSPKGGNVTARGILRVVLTREALG